MYDGKLVGIHLEFVNSLREHLDRKETVDERLNEAEASLHALVAGAGQGTCVALLATQFKLDVAAAGARSQLPQLRRRR